MYEYTGVEDVGMAKKRLALSIDAKTWEAFRAAVYRAKAVDPSITMSGLIEGWIKAYLEGFQPPKGGK